ncbi:response regulator transcription factor [Ruminiclostridium josui]|uniref:response regulator transcription factor n=1 Tax=Ruminiclostridium josui TaxID=1499 RepID=UPI000463D304|nr:response regulator transcription factor [Ruminiclostridium josui]
MTDFAKKILVVDDEAKISDVVKSYLEHAGYKVFTAVNGKEAMEGYNDFNPDLIILDLMLPDISGEEICKRIRKNSSVPIIMLTAKVADDEVITGLDIGADDYVLKPFSPRQLLARVAAVLRRTVREPVEDNRKVIFDNGDLAIDTFVHEIRKAGNIINLTPNEYRILVTMARYPKKAFTREELISMALGDDFEGFDRTVDTHIKNIRQKIEDDPKTPKYLVTVHGVGYRFAGEF